MKKLILAFSVLCLALPSYAAKWEKVSLTSSAFAHLKDIELYSSVYKLVSKKDSEPLINSLKQLTYIVRSEWGLYSMPEYVDVYPGDLDFSVLTSDDTRQEPYPLTEETLGALAEYSIMPGFDVEIFEGTDANPFGDCANVYLYEKKSQQVALFSLCYAE